MVRRLEVAWRVLHPGVVGQVRPSVLQGRVWGRRQDQVQEISVKLRGGPGLLDSEVLVLDLMQRVLGPEREQARDRREPVQHQGREGLVWRLGWVLALLHRVPEQVRGHQEEEEVRGHQEEEEVRGHQEEGEVRVHQMVREQLLPLV